MVGMGQDCYMLPELKLLAVDSDGCALDAMEAKHRQCFTPAVIDVWKLHALADVVTDLALRINLYSRERGINRFAGLNLLFKLLHARVSQEHRHLLPSFAALDYWVTHSAKLSESSLKEAMRGASYESHEALEVVLRWTHEVNRRVSQLASPRPFESVADTLALAQSKGLRLCVVSSATRTAIEHEWECAGIAGYVHSFYGQEEGTKAAVLKRLAAEQGSARAVLMVGDALGDYAAAKAADCLFFPIIPTLESRSWQLLHRQWMARLPGHPDPALLRIEEARFLGALPEI